jgi:hemerythrin-like domain-containing protein
MLRDQALIPLSRQHQRALALCVRIERAPRATPDELRCWQQEIIRLFEQEIRLHFDAEEHVLFPAAERLPALRSLVADLRREHGQLRAAVVSAVNGSMDSKGLSAFASLLSSHIRREERELFESMQKLFSPEELFRLGAAIDHDFRIAGLPGSSCEIKN